MKCKTCGYNGGKKNHSCALQLKRQIRNLKAAAEDYLKATRTVAHSDEAWIANLNLQAAIKEDG